MKISTMKISDYEECFQLWSNTEGMGFRSLVYSDNENGNAFWEKLGFTKREDLTYRNRSIDIFNV